MGKIAVMGTDQIEMGAAGANGIMGTVLGIIGALAMQTVKLGVPDPDKTDIEIEDSDDPYVSTYTRKAKTLEFATRDVSNAMLLKAFGGTLIESLAAPVIPILTGSASGGTLAAATYYIKQTAINDDGETLGSPEASVATTGSTSSIGVAGTVVAGAAKYRTYIGTAPGAQNKYFETLTPNFNYVGAAGTAGTVPTVSTAPDGSSIFEMGEQIELPEQSLRLTTSKKNGFQNIFSWPRCSIVASMDGTFTKDDTISIKFVATFLTPFDADGNKLPVMTKKEIPV